MDCDALVSTIRAAFPDAPNLDSPASDGLPDDLEAWSRFDAAEFRALLPGAMIQSVQTGRGRALCWWLTLPLSGDEELYLQRWSLLDPAQRECVRAFLRAMIEREAPNGEAEPWEEAYESYWADVQPGDGSPR